MVLASCIFSMSHVQDQPGSLLPSYSLLPEDLCVLPSQIVTAQDYLQNSQILRLQCLERLEKGKSFQSLHVGSGGGQGATPSTFTPQILKHSLASAENL
jgi:hypothetical protein